MRPLIAAALILSAPTLARADVINVTGGITFGQTPGVLIGGALYSTVNVTPDANVKLDTRDRYFVTNITIPPTGSAAADESDFFNVSVSGTGTTTGEINIVHPYFAAGKDGSRPILNNNVEQFEASGDNYTSMNGMSEYLAIFNNKAGATLKSLVGFNTYVNNDNTTAGSLSSYAGFQCSGVHGVGAPAAVDYCLRNGDPNGSISTLGHVLIGGIGFSGANTQLQIQGPDTATGSFPLVAKNSAGKNLLTVNDNGDVVTGASLTTSTVALVNNTSGRISIIPPANVALSNTILTLPATTGTLQASSVAPNGASFTGLGSSPVVVGATAAAFQVTVGTGSTSSPATVSFFTAGANGYACQVTDNTNPGTFNVKSVSTSPTMATWYFYNAETNAAQAPANGDVLTAMCTAF